MSRKFRTKEWAIMMFIANDNDLDKFTEAKIAEIKSVGSTRASDVIIQFDTRGTSFIRRMRLSKGRAFPLRALQDETNTGDKRTLIRFVDLTLEDFHPRRSMLVISNHGSGFDIAGDQEIARAIEPARDAEGRPRKKTHSRRPIFWTATSRTAAFAVLEAGAGSRANADTLDLLELKSAMSSIVRRHGRIELLAFDACLMGTFEVAYQLRNTAHVMVASQSNIPVPGCHFASTFELMRDEKLTTAAAAKALVDDVTPVVGDEYSAMAAMDLELSDTLAEAISVLADTLISALRNDAEALEGLTIAHLSALTFLDSDTVDLFDLCHWLAETMTSDYVREAATDVQEAVEQFVFHAAPWGAVVEGARGVSITLPRHNAVSDAYRQLDFARETSWMEFLDLYLAKRFKPISDGAP